MIEYKYSIYYNINITVMCINAVAVDNHYTDMESCLHRSELVRLLLSKGACVSVSTAVVVVVALVFIL